MIRIFKRILLLIVACIMVMGNSFVFAKEENKESEYIQNRTNIINDMAKAMNNPERTGEVTIDYLYETIAHYEGTVNMCKNYIKYSNDRDTKKIAENIIKDETTSMDEMKNIIETLKEDVKEDKEKETKYIKEYNLIFKNTMCKFQKLKTTGNVDKDFLKEITIQHECSIKMNELINKTTENEEIKEIATKQSEAQNAQLENINKCMEKIK